MGDECSPSAQPTSEPSAQPTAEPSSEPSSEPPPTGVGYNMWDWKIREQTCRNMGDPISPSYLPLVDESNTSFSSTDSWNIMTVHRARMNLDKIISRSHSRTPRVGHDLPLDPSGVDIDIHLLPNL